MLCIFKLSTPSIPAVNFFFLFQINAHNVSNTHIYRQLLPTCFGVCYTIFRETIALLTQELYALMFAGPCIVLYFCSKINQMHNISNLFYFGTTLCMFRTVFPSTIRSLRPYIRHQVCHTVFVAAC